MSFAHFDPNVKPLHPKPKEPPIWRVRLTRLCRRLSGVVGAITTLASLLAFGGHR